MNESVSTWLYISALGIYFHAIFVSITLGFPLVIIALLIKYWKSRDPYYLSVTRKLTFVLFVNFALGAVTGTLVEFGLVQIWPGTIIAIASFALAPLALELIAFAGEIVFLVLFAVTLGRIFIGYSIAIILVYWVFALFSGMLITAVNSWLIAPWGTGDIPKIIYPFLPSYGPLSTDPATLVALKILLLASGSPLQAVIQQAGVSETIGIILNDPLVAFITPYSVPSILHNLVAAIIIGSMIVVAAYGYRYYKTGDQRYLNLIKVVFVPVLILILIQPTVIGHFMGTAVVNYNPVKFALMERATVTYNNPLIALLAYGDPSHPIIGFDEFRKQCDAKGGLTLGELAKALKLTKASLLDLASKLNVKVDEGRLDAVLNTRISDVCKRDLDRAYSKMNVISVTYYVKILAGIIAFLSTIILASIVYDVKALSNLVRRFISPDRRWVFILTSATLVGVVLSAILGWYVREVGRKPWTVYGLLYPEELISISHIAEQTLFQLIVVLVILVVGLGGIYAMYIVATREIRFLDLLMKGVGSKSRS